MYYRSAETSVLVRRSNTAINVMDVLHSGKPAVRLKFTDGQVGAEGGRTVTRNLQGTIVDPSGNLDGSDINDLLSPYDCEVAPYRGVLLSDGSYELAPLGVYRLTNRQVTEPGAISISGQDRAIIYQGSMSGTLSITGGTPIETAIHKLLSRRNSALTMHTWVTGFTCGPLIYPAEIDVWKEAQDLAKSVGGVLYHDRHGDLVFEPGLPVSENPVATYAYGDGVLLDADRAEDADTIHNVVIVVSTKAGLAGTLTGIALDNDPTSPTYAYGRYGYKPITIENQHIGTQLQADQMAAHELAKQLGLSEEVTITIPPDAWLDPNDVVLGDYPKKDIIKRSLVIASYTMPLNVRSSLTLRCRRSIIGQDGRVLDNGATLDGN